MNLFKAIVGGLKSLGRSVQRHLGIVAGAVALGVGTAVGRAADFVTVDGTTYALTFDFSTLVAGVLNAAAAAVNGAIPLVIFSAAIWVVCRMFGLVGKVKR